jgi:DnaK suppressor protein
MLDRDAAARIIMTKPNAGLDPAFVEKQRQSLLRLQASLLADADLDESDAADLRASSGRGQEAEDDAQKLAGLELDDNLVVRATERLRRIERALQKIQDGTYGVSDQSGHAIPRERLEAVPETTLTLKEESAVEKPG